ncbi:glutaredoxin 3 [Rickettsiaceae bacterium]|nr:glutaredoxin 3 [Rickettsiaceae bacterium]
MKKVVIYTTTVCPFCVRAKALLDRKNIPYEEINAEDEKVRNQMIKKSDGAKSVPQIFIGDQHIGGSDDLHALEQDGKLDKLLS